MLYNRSYLLPLFCGFHQYARRTGCRLLDLYNLSSGGPFSFIHYASVCSCCSAWGTWVWLLRGEIRMWPEHWALEERWKHTSVHYFPTLRIHSNDIVIKHLGESPRSKFQERFAYHIWMWYHIAYHIGVRRGTSGGALQGTCCLQRLFEKKSAFEKVRVDAKLLHTWSCTALSYFLVLQTMSL